MCTDPPTCFTEGRMQSLALPSLIFFPKSQLGCATGPLAFTPVCSQQNGGWGGPSQEEKNHLPRKTEGEAPSSSKESSVSFPGGAQWCGTSPTTGPGRVPLPTLTHPLAEATVLKSPTGFVPTSLCSPAPHSESPRFFSPSFLRLAPWPDHTPSSVSQ